MTQEEVSPLIARLRQSIGDRIRTEREAKGWTQTQLAEMAGTNQQTVDRLERGVTSRSKAYPKIMEALGIPGHHTYNEDIHGTVERMIEASRGNPMKDDAGDNRILDAVKKWSDRSEKIPVYATSQGGIVLVTAIDPMFPVELVRGAYGLLCSTEAMAPAVRRGEIVIANPHLPLQTDSEVVVIEHYDRIDFISIMTLTHEDDLHWTGKTWAPVKTYKVDKREPAAVHMVVAKVSRYR